MKKRRPRCFVGTRTTSSDSRQPGLAKFNSTNRIQARCYLEVPVRSARTPAVPSNMASRMNAHSESVGTGVMAVTVRLALAGLALFPALVCRAPAGIVSTRVPAAAAVTSTPMAQDPDGIVLAAVKVTVDPPAGAVTVPAPQLL